MSGDKRILNTRDLVRGKVILALLVVTSKIQCNPVPLNPSFEGGEESSTTVHLGEKDDNKSFLRAVALFIVILLVLSMAICMCAMYCCIYWALQCPGTATMQSLLDAISRSCNRLISTRRTRRIEKRNRRSGKKDLPPAYEVIIASDQEREFALKSKANHCEEEPPSYTQAMLHEESGAMRNS